MLHLWLYRLTLLLAIGLVPTVSQAGTAMAKKVPAMVAARSIRSIPPCAATPVHRTPFRGRGLQGIPWIRAAPASAGITGHLFFVRPGARGRAAELHTDGTMPHGASAKILWIIDHGNVGGSITIEGRNLTGSGRAHQVFPAAGGGSGGGSQYPSIVDVPRPGCWRFRLGSGTVAGTVTLPVVASDSAAPPLGPVPQSCPANPPPASVSSAFGKAIGMSPVWVIGFTRGLTLHIGNPFDITHGPHGWYRKILWVVAPGYRQRVTLSGGALRGGAPLWFQIGDHAPSTAPVLDPGHPGVPGGGSWGAQFPSYLFIPRAGCYVLQAGWPGGMWRLTFAAGQ